MAPKPLKKGATYDDLRDVPENFVAEMFDGELYATPRPALPHAHAATVLGGKLGGPFHRNGPGGWVILDEPELHFGNDVLVPDLAGWRRERVPTLPADAYHDAGARLDLRGAVGVHRDARSRHEAAHLRTRRRLSCLARRSAAANARSVAARVGSWNQLDAHEGNVKVRAPPFDAIELELGALWI